MEEVNRVSNIIDEYEEKIARATLLYQYKTSRYQDFLETLKNLESNVLKLFSSLSIFVTVFVIIIRYNTGVLLHVAPSPAQAAALTAAGVAFVTLCSAWSYVFRAVASANRAEFPLEEVDDDFHNEDRERTLSLLINWYSAAIKDVEVQYNAKSLLVGKAFNDMIFTGCGFIVFAVFIYFINIA